MLHNEKSNDDDHLNLQEGGGLTKQTLTDRKRDSNFVKYFEENKDTDVGLGELVNTEKLAVKGCADTDHKEEIPAKTLRKSTSFFGMLRKLWRCEETRTIQLDILVKYPLPCILPSIESFSGELRCFLFSTKCVVVKRIFIQ